MNRKISRTNRNYIIIGLCAILVIMGVGYAAFQSQLKISGTSNIGANFNVKITSITPNSIVGMAEDKPEITTYNDTSATFGVSLKSPGDSITYDITIENQGTIDAILKTITKTDTNNSAILFETSGVNENDELKVGETATMKVKVTYNPEVTSQPTDLDSTLNVELDYEQSTGEVVPPEPTTITPNDLKALAVIEGDGLYADEYEPGRFIYKGANPNNYIAFNNETWRILSLEADGSLKLLAKSDGVNRFDQANSNTWETSPIKTYLNEEYLATITMNQDKIVPHTWSIGGVTYNNSDLAAQINDENETISQTASVGLITASEYLRANPNIEQCGNYSLNNTNRTTCKTTNWIYNIVPSGALMWTISPIANSNSHLHVVSANAYYYDTDGALYSYPANGEMVSSGIVYPSLYLTSSIKLQGSGTEQNPFTIVS